MRCRPACPACLRLVSSVPSHLIGYRLARLLPALRHGWAGREAGSVDVLCLLGSVLRSVLMSADVDSRFMLLPLRCPIGLLACRLRCRCSHLVVWMRCDAPLAHRLVSRLVHRLVGRLGSSFLSPRLETRWAGRRAIALRLRCASFLVLISPPTSFPVLNCLGAFLAIHLMRMAAEICGLSSRRDGCLLCPVVSVPLPSFVSDPGRFIPWLVRLMRLGAVALMSWRGCEFGLSMPYRVPSHPLRLLYCVSLLKRRGRRRLPCLRPRFDCLRFTFRLASRRPVLAHVLAWRRALGVSFIRLACPRYANSPAPTT